MTQTEWQTDSDLDMSDGEGRGGAGRPGAARGQGGRREGAYCTTGIPLCLLFQDLLFFPRHSIMPPDGILL